MRLYQYSFRVVNAVYKVLGHASTERPCFNLQADVMFAEMDKNSDGMITQQEFIEACKGNKVKLHLI